MNAASNLQFTWKRMAEEREEAARNMARIAIGLFVACNLLAFTAYSSHSSYSEVCREVDQLNPSLARSSGDEVVATMEAVRAQCQ